MRKSKFSTPPEYTAWVHLRSRCYNPADPSYPSWGGRGIGACENILSGYIVLLTIIGPKPTFQHSLDRPDNNGGYWCGQCQECVANQWPLNIKWSTAKEQANNTRRNVHITNNGETKPLADWAAELKTTPNILYVRRSRGYTTERVIAPVKRRLKSIITKPQEQSRYGRRYKG